ncbi:MULTISPECIES: tyrosine-type recombinase/integrase [unclassified Pseudomonas]|uniref:tyrosine-type recombinase/integrase n=2 Tax=Pseudomonas TaxID=286 RepID=UPI0030D9CDCF
MSVSRTKKPGLCCDGVGFYLQVTKAGVKSWLFRYMRSGKARGMGLGPLHTVSLAEARTKALNCRRKLLDGIDPLDEKRHLVATRKADQANQLSFDECAKKYIAAHRSSWKNAKHAAQWQSTLDAYASPVFGSLPVSTLDTGLVMQVIEPVWTVKTETASRVRGRIESVLDWATVRGYRKGENPARWKGHLDHLLPRKSKIQKVKHHAALPYEEASTFVHTLRALDGVAARAFELLILTATRTSETIGACKAEVDLDAKVWTIPAERMKVPKEHRIPLCPQAIKLLRPLIKDASNKSDYLFPGNKTGTHLSNMALLQLLRRLERPDLTAHGFRSTFRDWARETTDYPREVAEAALAHTIRDKTEAAYARGDLFEKRRIMMEHWSRYLNTQSK